MRPSISRQIRRSSVLSKQLPNSFNFQNLIFSQTIKSLFKVLTWLVAQQYENNELSGGHREYCTLKPEDLVSFNLKQY